MKHATGRLLRWVDTDISYLARGGGWAATSQLLGIALSLGTSFVLANFLTQTEYGTYKYVLAVAAFFAIPALSGMNTAVLQAVAQGYDGTVRVALTRRLIWSSLGILSGSLISTYYFIQGDSTLGWAFLVAGVCSPLAESLSTAHAALIGKKRFDIASAESMATATLSAVAVITAVLVTHNPLWVLVAFFASTLLIRVAATFVVRRHLENSRVSNESLSFGVHTSIAGILGVIATNADVFVMWHTAGAESVALYAFALAAVVPFQTLIKTMLNLAHPKFAAQDKRSLVLSAKRRGKQTFILLIPIVGMVVLVLPQIFTILFPNYLGAILFAQIFALSVLLYPEKLYGIALTVARESRAIYLISTVSAVTRIGFLFVLIPIFGAWGAVVAMILQQIATLLTTRILFYQFERKVFATSV